MTNNRVYSPKYKNPFFITIKIMKKTFMMAMAIVAAMAITSCKSSKTLTEAATVAEPSQQVEEVQAISYTTPKRTAPVAQPGDRQEKVTVVNSSDQGLLKDYNVVVGAFGNKANAEGYKNKMAQRGYNAFLVQNAQGLYRVVAAGFDNRADAVVCRDNIRSTYASDDAGTAPAAWLLVPAM